MSLHTNLQIWHNQPVQSFGLSFDCRASDAYHFNRIFSAELSCQQYLLLWWWSHCYNTMREHCVYYQPNTRLIPGTIMIELTVPIFPTIFFVHIFVDKKLANTCEDWSLDKGLSKGDHFSDSIFSILWLVPTSSEMYSAFTSVFYVLQVLTSSRA